VLVIGGDELVLAPAPPAAPAPVSRFAGARRGRHRGAGLGTGDAVRVRSSAAPRAGRAPGVGVGFTSSGAQLRVIYYTHSAFWEPALSLVRELSQRAEVHLLVELAPSAWTTGAFDVPRRELRPGLVAADEVMAGAVPPEVRAYWQHTASFHLVVHGSRRSFHPASWRRSREVLRFARAVGADVVHVDDVDVSPRLALGLLRRWDIPIVLNVHDPEPHSGERGWRKTVARSVAYRQASRFILHNGAQRAEFLRRYGLPPERVSVVGLGAYDILRAWADPDATAGRPAVLFFGRISPYKGLDVLYAAAAAVAESVPAVRFVIAGKPISGYDPPKAPALPPPATLEVISTYIDNRTLARLLRDAAVVVCPYTDATQSGVVLTAYGFDTPVVASAVGGLPEYVADGRTGLLVPPNDPAALAAALIRLLGSGELLARLSAGIRARKADELSWSRAAARVVELYDALV
jgi:glycosyltransferase involved in cell wall biosynthesis